VSPPAHGVGTELERLINRTRAVLALFRLAWIIPSPEKCGCNSARLRLNADGPAACLANRSRHVADIYARWLKHWPHVRLIPFASSLIAAYLTRAAKNTRRKESA